MRKIVLLLAVAVSAVLLSSATAMLAMSPDAARAAQICTGTDVYPSQNLPNVAKRVPPGMTFCIHDGTYKISSPVIVQSGDVFVGLYNDDTPPVVTTTSSFHIFYAGTDPASAASGATIKDLTVSGAVGNAQCQPACGRGISGGKNLTVDNVRATGNMNQGVGGALPGLVVRNSTMDYNGSAAFATSINTNSSAGVKSANSMTVINSNIHHNWWNGVWCDEECNALTVRDSKITDNGKSGIHYEISTGPTVITSNTIQRNGWNDAVPNKRGGLLIVDSTNADVYSNIFGDNFQNIGVQVVDYKDREPAVSNVSIHGNTMTGDLVIGCEFTGASCIGNN
jgi:hypothetical protein